MLPARPGPARCLRIIYRIATWIWRTPQVSLAPRVDWGDTRSEQTELRGPGRRNPQGRLASSLRRCYVTEPSAFFTRPSFLSYGGRRKMAGDACVERPLFGGSISSTLPLRFQVQDDLTPPCLPLMTGNAGNLRLLSAM